MDVAGTEKHRLGFNISIKQSSMSSARKNQSMKLNAKLAVRPYLTAEPK